jgi:hypothetical protein
MADERQYIFARSLWTGNVPGRSFILPAHCVEISGLAYFIAVLNIILKFSPVFYRNSNDFLVLPKLSQITDIVAVGDQLILLSLIPGKQYNSKDKHAIVDHSLCIKTCLNDVGNWPHVLS